MTVATGSKSRLGVRVFANRVHSFKCGSDSINIQFKDWLRAVLGDIYYYELDPASLGEQVSQHIIEGKGMRGLMKGFIAMKRRFSKEQNEVYMNLPPPLDELDIPGRLIGGLLKITWCVLSL